MGEPTNVLDTVANAGENKVTVYNDNLVEIFAHAKTEILELNEKMENRELLRLRNSVLISSDRGSAVQNTGPTQQQREPSSNEIINSTSGGSSILEGGGAKRK